MYHIYLCECTRERLFKGGGAVWPLQRWTLTLLPWCAALPFALGAPFPGKSGQNPVLGSGGSEGSFLLQIWIKELPKSSIELFCFIWD